MERKKYNRDKGHLRRNSKTRGNVTGERKGQNIAPLDTKSKNKIYCLA